jgi:hypothetical protein
MKEGWSLKLVQKVKLIKKAPCTGTFKCISLARINYFSLSSGVTESFFLPLALREESTLLPLAVDILSLNPCLFALFLLDG